MTHTDDHLNKLADLVHRTARFSRKPLAPGTPLSYLVMGLAGETGETVEIFKKALRRNPDASSLDCFMLTPDELDALALELGDILWYIQGICLATGLSIREDVIDRLVTKLEERYQTQATPPKGDDANDEHGG